MNLPHAARTMKSMEMGTASSAESLSSEELELRPYQQEGALWLSLSKMALLADDCGLGKSAQAITAADLADCHRILVLTPAAARVNWLREFTKFSSRGREFTILKKKKDVIPHQNSVISSYDLAVHIPPTEHFDALILDESHFLRNGTAKRTRIVFGKSGLVRRAKRIWCLSATPMAKAASDLWILLFSFGRTRLSYFEFVERFCTYYDSPYGRNITGTKIARTTELREALEPIMLRRRKEDVLRDLPAITFGHVVVEAGEIDFDTCSSFIQYVFPQDRRHELKVILDKEQKIVDAVLSMGVPTVRNAEGFPDTLKALEAVAKSVSTLRRYTGLQKMSAAADLVEEELIFGAYDKIVIFAIHRDVIEGLRVRLERFRPVTLYGNTPDQARQKNIDRFQSNPHIRVFIANINAAGTAINLTAASQVMFVEESWLPADNAQAAMRVHRIGQTKPVSVRVLGLANSFDEKISAVLKTRMKQIAAVFDDEEQLVLPEYAGRAKAMFLKNPIT